MSQQTHQADPRILNHRTLEHNHRRLAALLRPGMSVLDVGCGTGAITAGIAKAVGASGHVVGVDRDESLLMLALQEHGDIENLRFEMRNVLSLEYEHAFDIVTAARMLQWIDDPEAALIHMKKAARAGGLIVVLDYNHDQNVWEPQPPLSFRWFYQAFLDWRTVNGWDNRMGDSLPRLFLSAGLRNIEIYNEDEIATRGDPDFFSASALWANVAQTLGLQIVAAGFLSEHERAEAEREYRDWITNRLEKQTLAMRTVVGRC